MERLHQGWVSIGVHLKVSVPGAPGAVKRLHQGWAVQEKTCSARGRCGTCCALAGLSWEVILVSEHLLCS